eukprot:TRINITY_DN50342_c0_g1_i1.p1 TRINITY_DN50342_c0_g1~~TRINITY_DN50342_c0_g1_i1.p1  ORF type:complete len:537 (-),score=106.11 TRINITY_DN50342_c0_g1_i1:50-1660(-)
MAPPSRQPLQPCPRITSVTDGLLLGGVGGGLQPKAIECLLQEHAVTHLVVCGRREADKHVIAAEEACTSCGAEVHVAALVPEDTSKVQSIIEAACAFMETALADEFNCVLVACSKGASRSVAVVLAYMIASQSASLANAFESVASSRWRIWPSALLVDALIGFETRQVAIEGGDPLDTAYISIVRRQIGMHAALATAWHNNVNTDVTAAETAWDEASAEDVTLEGVFASCKRRLLGLGGVDLADYGDETVADGPSRGQLSVSPQVDVCTIQEGLMLCGFGSLSADAVGDLLEKHSVVSVVVCGRPGRDKHVDVALAALNIAGLSADALHVVPVADSATESICKHFDAAVAFIRKVHSSAVRSNQNILIACRQGASRSVSVATAFKMMNAPRGTASVLGAFREVAARRWRLWPNAGFVDQLLNLEDQLRASDGRMPASTEDRLAAQRAIGVHAAWASNRQNLEETGFGRAGLSMDDAEQFWEQATETTTSTEECFEKCKALCLGVDLSAFENGTESGIASNTNAVECEDPPCKMRRI